MMEPGNSAESQQQRGLWLSRLETELARELGQPVSLAPGGEPLEGATTWTVALILPAVEVSLSVASEEMAGVLVAGRVIAAEQADAETVRELWTGILTSVAARLEGKVEVPEGSRGEAGEPCTLRLGDAAARLILGVKEQHRASPSAPFRSETTEAARAEAGRGNYDLLLEVELDAQVRFGCRELELKELLELGPGDVVELDRNVADPVDLIVGGRIVARGEVVLIEGNFGVRVTEVAEPVRRLESIRCMA